MPIDRKTGTLNGFSANEIFNAKIRDADNERWQKITRAERFQTMLETWWAGVDSDAIYLLDHNRVRELEYYADIDAYRWLAYQCSLSRRPYIKCTKTSASRIVVSVVGSGPERGVVSPLLIQAEQLVPQKKRHRRTFEEKEMEPDLMGETGYMWTDASVATWVTPRTISIMFQGSRGADAFNDWAMFCRSNPTNRVILGIRSK